MAVSIKFSGDDQGAKATAEALAKALDQLGISADKVNFQFANQEKAGDSLFGKARDWQKEQMQQGRTARFYANELSSILPISKDLGVNLQSLTGILVEGAAGGLGIGLAFEGVKLAVGLVAEEMTKATKEALANEAAFAKLDERIQNIGKSARQVQLEKAISAKSILEEYRAAKQGADIFGANVNGEQTAEGARLEAAKAALDKLAEANGIVGGELANTEALVARLQKEVEQTESDLRNKAAIARAEQQEKDATRQVGLAKGTNAKILADKLATLAKLDEAQRKAEEKQFIDATKNGPGSVADFAALESPAFAATEGKDEVQHAADLALKRSLADRKRDLAELTNAGKRMGDVVGHAFLGMATGSMSAGKAMTNVLGAVGQTLTQMASKWATAKVTELLASKATATGEITASAGVAGAEVAAQMASNPFTLAAAIPAGEAMAASVLASFGPYAAASGGWDIGAALPPVAQLHPREMVLPAPLADRVRSMTDAPGRQVMQQVTIVAHDPRSFERYLRDNPTALVNALRDLSQSGRL